MRMPAVAMAYFYPCAQLVMCGGTFFGLHKLQSGRILNAIENYCAQSSMTLLYIHTVKFGHVYTQGYKQTHRDKDTLT